MMNYVLAIAFIYQQALEVVCAVIGLIMIRRSWPFAYRLLVFICCFIALSELISFACILLHYPSQKFFNIYVSIETITLAYILFCETTLGWSRRLLRVLLIVLPVGLVAAFTLPANGLSISNMYADTLQLLVLIIASCAVLVDILHDMSGTSLYTRPAFWFSLTMLVSSSIFLLLEAFMQYMKNHMGTRPFFMPFIVVANTIMYGGFVKCFLVLKKGATCPSK